MDVDEKICVVGGPRIHLALRVPARQNVRSEFSGVGM